MKFTLMQECIAEFLGTMVLILFGCGVVAMVKLFGNGDFTNINWAWGFGVLFGIFTAGTISGAHLNPAVSVGFAAVGRFPWSKVLPFSIAQLLGAFVGAAIVFGVYHDQFLIVDPTLSETAGVFATFPALPGFWPGFFDQVVGTALLMGLILAIVDKLNNRDGGAWGPLAIALIVVAIGMSFGSLHGYAINPARDLGPRLFAMMAGFSNNGFEELRTWIVPIVGPIVGAVVGAFIYQFAIGNPIQSAHLAFEQEQQGMDTTQTRGPQ